MQLGLVAQSPSFLPHVLETLLPCSPQLSGLIMEDVGGKAPSMGDTG